MTLSAPEPSPNTAAAAADPRQDPAMRSLYRMSRTAGVGLQDYAAVNVFAVVGLLLAVASVLVLIFADVLPMLLLPLAAVVVSTAAFVQIQGSNGTQTGRGIALAGILISLGLAGVNVAGRVADASRDRADRASIEQLLKQFQDASFAGKWSDAYALFDDRFHAAVKPETFERTLDTRIVKWFGGPKMTSISLGDRVVFETDANGVRFATGLLRFRGDGNAPDGSPLLTEELTEFRQVDGVWKFHTITSWFASAMQPKPGQPTQAGQ